MKGLEKILDTAPRSDNRGFIRSWSVRQIAANGMLLLSVAGCRAPTKFSESPYRNFEATGQRRYAFKASQVLDGYTKLVTDSRYQEFELVVPDQEATVEMFQQMARPFHELSVKQGHESQISREVFAASSSGVLDLLVVIDDSKSMKQELKELGSKLDSLLTHVVDTDWQIAVIRMSDARLQANHLIRKGDANAAKKFEAAIAISSFDPNNTEQGFPKAIESLEASCVGCESWIRPQSAVGVLIVSDEDNCGSGAGEIDRCKNIKGKNADEMLGFLQKIRPGGMGRVYGLVKQSSSECPNAAGVGVEYLKAIVATGGVSGSICAADYGNALASISRNVSSIVRKEYQLSGAPDLNFFKVEADGVEVTAQNAWVIAGDKITINPEVFAGAKQITFLYSHGAEPKFNELTLNNNPDPATLQVVVNGKALDSSDYSFDSSHLIVGFVTPPADDAVVDIRWRENIALNDRFHLSHDDIEEEGVEVKLNGELVDPSLYDRDGTQIHFKIPPRDGALIAANYKTLGGRVTSLNPPIRREVVGLAVMDIADGHSIESDWDGHTLKIPNAEAIAGKRLQVKVDYGDKPTSSDFVLPESTIVDTVKVKLDGVDQNCEISRDSTETAKISVHCQGVNDYELMELIYRYETPLQFQFSIPATASNGGNNQKTDQKTDQDTTDQDTTDQWIDCTVRVDGQDTADFTRDGRVFTVNPKVLKRESLVEIMGQVWTREAQK